MQSDEFKKSVSKYDVIKIDRPWSYGRRFLVIDLLTTNVRMLSIDISLRDKKSAIPVYISYSDITNVEKISSDILLFLLNQSNPHVIDAFNHLKGSYERRNSWEDKKLQL